jgi:ABC-type transport system involved in multi-copper enzyme maturation permease subunit
MNQVLAIARASLLEHVRRKLIAFFVLGSLAFTGFLLYVATTQESALARTFAYSDSALATFASLSFLPLFALLAALAVSMGNINRPFTSGEILMVLARPVSRVQFAAGRLVASVAVVVALCALLAVETQVVSVVDTGSLFSLLWGHWAAAAFSLCVIAALTTLFSSALAAPGLAAVLGYLVYQGVGPVTLGHNLVRQGTLHGGLARIIDAAYYLMPKFFSSPLVLRARNAPEPDMIAANTPAHAVWAVGYLAVVVALVLWRTQQKDA